MQVDCLCVQLIENELKDHYCHFNQLSKEANEKFQTEDSTNAHLGNKTQELLKEVQIKLQLASEKAIEKQNILEEALLNVSC